MGLSQGMQSQKIHSMDSKLMEEDTIQQPTLAIMETSSFKGPCKKEQQMEEGHSGHVFS